VAQFLIYTIFAAVYNTGPTPSLSLHFPLWDPVHAVIAEEQKGLGSYQVWYLVVAYEGLTFLWLLWPIIFYALYGGYVKSTQAYAPENGGSYYKEVLFLGINKLSWIEWAFTLATITWITANLAGIVDLFLTIALTVMTIVVCLAGGLLFEYVNTGIDAEALFNVNDVTTQARPIIPEGNYTSENLTTPEKIEKEYKMSYHATETVTDWWPFIFGFIILNVVIWTFVLVYFIEMVVSAPVGIIPWFAWAACIGAPAFWVLMLIVLIIPYAVYDLRTRPKGGFTYEVLTNVIERNGVYELCKLILVNVFKSFFLWIMFAAIF